MPDSPPPWRPAAPRARRIAVLLTTGIWLAACGPIRATAIAPDEPMACLAFAPITYSAAGDTAWTIRQIREHNAGWDALCPGAAEAPAAPGPSPTSTGRSP